MDTQRYKTGRFAGFSVHDEFAQAALRESPVIFNLGAISWPDGLVPTAATLGDYKPATKITGPVDFKADVLIVLNTNLETSAFLDVFTGNNAWTTARQKTWYDYAHNFATIANGIEGIDDSSALKDGFFGYLSVVMIGDQTVVIFKAELHAKINGDKLPIVAVIQQLVTELRPSLVLGTGTAGAMGSVLNCGDVAVTNTARFVVSTTYPTYPEINTLSQTEGSLSNTVAINDKYLAYAAENFTKLTLPALTKCHAEFAGRSGYEFLKANTEPPSIYVTGINPVPGPEPMVIVSADFLSADDSTNAEGLEKLGIMNDSDDAYTFFAITQMPADQQPKWLSVRNASDPQAVVPPIAPGTSQAKIQKEISAVVGAIFGVYEYVTTINSAFACWAIVAGNASQAGTSTQANHPAHKKPHGQH